MKGLHFWLTAPASALLLFTDQIPAQSVQGPFVAIVVYEEYKEESIPAYQIWEYRGRGEGAQQKTIVDPSSHIAVSVSTSMTGSFCLGKTSFGAVLVNSEGTRQIPFEAVIEKVDQPLASLDGPASIPDGTIWQKAILDLKLSGARDGDLLYLYIEVTACRMNHRHRKNGMRGKMQMGRYRVRATRWNTKVSDAFVLVNRLGEDRISDRSDLSPSNFKGAPGAALLYNWYDDGASKNKRFWGRAMNALEPTLGIHVNYLDFIQSRDLELGTALVIGLFRSRLMFSVGYNLNTDHPSRKPFYMGLGVSFANLAGNLSN